MKAQRGGGGKKEKKKLMCCSHPESQSLSDLQIPLCCSSCSGEKCLDVSALLSSGSKGPLAAVAAQLRGWEWGLIGSPLRFNQIAASAAMDCFEFLSRHSLEDESR